ncbi:hypothetical protein DFH11DRAFT_1731721 [Phellopilus nigrolimitatus]|nr:hypothetical protein DFH11DRAFT_1731721 [Phellopilus nigrolimitatus]
MFVVSATKLIAAVFAVSFVALSYATAQSQASDMSCVNNNGTLSCCSSALDTENGDMDFLGTGCETTDEQAPCTAPSVLGCCEQLDGQSPSTFLLPCQES